jgi:hypothetical protein
MHVNEKTGHRCYYSCKEATGHITQWLADEDEEDEAPQLRIFAKNIGVTCSLWFSFSPSEEFFITAALHFPRKETNRNKEAIGNATGTTPARFVNTLPQQCLSIQ